MCTFFSVMRFHGFQQILSQGFIIQKTVTIHGGSWREVGESPSAGDTSKGSHVLAAEITKERQSWEGGEIVWCCLVKCYQLVIRCGTSKGIGLQLMHKGLLTAEIWVRTTSGIQFMIQDTRSVQSKMLMSRI